MQPIVRTERLVLRCWEPGDVPALAEAIDESLAELRPWIPWAASDPSPLDVLEARVAAWRNRFTADEDWTFAMTGGDGRLLGGVGLYPRIGPGGLEVGYWVRTGAAHQGLATEAVTAIARLGFADRTVERLEIHCDPRNLRSSAIARRLGFSHTATIAGQGFDPDGVPRDTEVWTLMRADAGALLT